MSVPVLITIEAGKTEKQYWKDIWHYRELFVFFAYRDILVRFKQTIIGVLWALIRPLLTMVVFSIVFGRIAKLPSNGIPYPILVFAAMLPWQFFAASLSECSNSLIQNSNLISKVFFPRIVIPFSAIVVNLVDLFISFSILVALMIWYHFIPNWKIITLPGFILIAFVASMGPGLWFASLNVKFRDFRYIVPFVVQFGLYISPVGFSSNIISEKWRFLYSLNPMVGVIDGFRWAILNDKFMLYWPGFLLSIGIMTVFFISGIWYFRKTEKQFADVI
jgi:lipopolysaccharide transport system permease protein